MEALKQQWQDGIQALGVTPTVRLIDGGLHLLKQLLRWNRAYNLTAITDPEAILSRHLLDSLSPVPFLQGEHIADVGTGGGFPGLVLALALPDKRFALIDSHGKKLRFVRQMVHELELKNVSVHHARVQALDLRVDAVVCRAFATLPDIVDWCAHLAPGGQLLAMKGKYPKEELAALPQRVTVREIRPIHVPGLTADRHLVNLCLPEISDNKSE